MKGQLGWFKRDSWFRAIIIVVALAPIGVVWVGDGTISWLFQSYVRESNFYAPYKANPAPDAGKRCIDNVECVTRWCKPDGDSSLIPIVGTCQEFPINRGPYEVISRGRKETIWSCD